MNWTPDFPENKLRSHTVENFFFLILAVYFLESEYYLGSVLNIPNFTKDYIDIGKWRNSLEINEGGWNKGGWKGIVLVAISFCFLVPQMYVCIVLLFKSMKWNNFSSKYIC